MKINGKRRSGNKADGFFDLVNPEWTSPPVTRLGVAVSQNPLGHRTSIRGKTIRGEVFQKPVQKNFEKLGSLRMGEIHHTPGRQDKSKGS
jgi:hypothetical protein